MFTTQPRPDRWQLGFTKAVRSSFAFLKKYGFRVVQEEVTLIRYQSEKVMLSVYHGRGSYELGVEFEREDFPGEKFTLYEVLNWAKRAGKIDAIPSGGYQASSREAVQKLVPRIAELVRKWGVPLLNGEPTVYQAIREQQTHDAAEYTKEVHLRSVRRQAEVAWQTKDYDALLNLYNSSQGDLTPSEFMRLQYAKKQLLEVHSSHSKNHI